jgi:hypothetical protein
VPLEIDTSGSCLLRSRGVKNQTAHDDDGRYHRHSTSFLVSHIREKPFATGTAHVINPHVTTIEETNLLDDRTVLLWSFHQRR